MFRPYIKQTKILVAIACINMLLVYASYKSYTFKPSENYDLNMKAALTMREALSHTEKMRNSLLEEKIKVSETDSVYDTFSSGLIGLKESPMTTKIGYLKSKKAVTNPNFTPIFIDYLSKIDSSFLDPNTSDTIAVSLTGSFPGANIALLSVCKTLNIHPIIISSLGSSSWGANELEMTWLDIENYLFENEFFNYKSSAFSLGGDNDIMMEVDQVTKDFLKRKILSKNYTFIYDSSLNNSVERRIELYKQKSKNYKAYINIGGSSASLGDTLTSTMYLPGLIYGKDRDIEDAYDEEYDYADFSTKPAIDYFLEIENIPVINIKNINNLCAWYNLPYNYEDYNLESITIGSNDTLFGEKIPFHPIVLWICLTISLILLGWVVLTSIKQVNDKMKEIDNESII